MAGVPQISHILRKANGGMKQVIEALRGYDDEDAQNFVEKYDSLSVEDRRRVTVEEIATACEIKTLDLLAAATKALFIENQTIAGIIASTSHPGIVKKSVEMAGTDGGHRDREMLHIAQGFLPSPKGSTFISQRIQVANFSDDAKPVEPETIEGVELPTMDDDILGMDALEKKMLLQAKNV